MLIVIFKQSETAADYVMGSSESFEERVERILIAAPLSVSDDAVRLAVIGKMRWIKKRQAQFAAQPRQTEREMVSGESHYVQGRRYRLHVVEHNGPAFVCLTNNATLELRVCLETGREKEEAVLHQ